MTALMTAILQPWEARALEKHLSRLQDQADLEAGRKSREAVTFREIAHRYRAVEEALSSIRFDEHGTPDRKLPAWPRCEEDELHIGVFHTSATCLRCNWRGTWTKQIGT